MKVCFRLPEIEAVNIVGKNSTPTQFNGVISHEPCASSLVFTHTLYSSIRRIESTIKRFLLSLENVAFIHGNLSCLFYL